MIGTDESRLSIHAYIWGMTAMNSPPSLWITINPTDTHDPIVQVLVGEEINLDAFDHTAGPDSAQCSKIVADDPYAAAKFFFHFVIAAILEELFGIRHGGGHGIIRRKGILGVIRGYIGAVEAQGRGTLHLHMLLWMQSALSGKEIQKSLQSLQFQSCISTCIASNIRAHHLDVTEDLLGSIPREKAVSYSRPLDPHDPSFERRHTSTEGQLVHAIQLHKCGPGCLKISAGHMLCKRRAPFPLAPEAWIDSNGNWGPQRTYRYLNNWNPTLLLATRSNHNIKLIMNGEGMKHITWYISSYAAKCQ
ncbi:hypothetical protein F4604DRAFT_1930451 [Suillus subluteus]|nr:hypothetical protein F4604DRAFT_1930451 [Suillus subluteus]